MRKNLSGLFLGAALVLTSCGQSKISDEPKPESSPSVPPAQVGTPQQKETPPPATPPAPVTPVTQPAPAPVVPAAPVAPVTPVLPEPPKEAVVPPPPPEARYNINPSFDATSLNLVRRIVYECETPTASNSGGELLKTQSTHFSCIPGYREAMSWRVKEVLGYDTAPEAPKRAMAEKFSAKLTETQTLLTYAIDNGLDANGNRVTKDMGVANYVMTNLHRNAKLPTGDLRSCNKLDMDVDFQYWPIEEYDVHKWKDKTFTTRFYGFDTRPAGEEFAYWYLNITPNTVLPFRFRQSNQKVARLWLHCDWKARPAYQTLETSEIHGNPALWSASIKVDNKEVTSVDKVNYQSLSAELTKLQVTEKNKLEINIDVFALRQDGVTELVATNYADSQSLTIKQKNHMRENCSKVNASVDLSKQLTESAKVSGTIPSKFMLCDLSDAFAEPIVKIQIKAPSQVPVP